MSKITAIIFRFRSLFHNCTIKIHNVSILWKLTVRYFGVILDKRLTWGLTKLQLAYHRQSMIFPIILVNKKSVIKKKKRSIPTYKPIIPIFIQYIYLFTCPVWEKCSATYFKKKLKYFNINV